MPKSLLLLVALSNLQSTPVSQRQNHHSAFCFPCQDIFQKTVVRKRKKPQLNAEASSSVSSTLISIHAGSPAPNLLYHILPPFQYIFCKRGKDLSQTLKSFSNDVPLNFQSTPVSRRHSYHIASAPFCQQHFCTSNPCAALIRAASTRPHTLRRSILKATPCTPPADTP